MSLVVLPLNKDIPTGDYVEWGAKGMGAKDLGGKRPGGKRPGSKRPGGKRPRTLHISI